MIDPKPADIGRKVVYRDRTGWKVEEGVITSFNDTCVFVRYARTSRSSTASRTLVGNYADQRAQTASLGPAGPDFGRHRRRHGTQRRRGAPGRSHFGNEPSCEECAGGGAVHRFANAPAKRIASPLL
jgi:hypothetical protein